jgi:PAS domain S-box-containing protein
MNDAIIGTDRDGRIQLMNDAAESITGWPAEAAVGRTLAEVFQITGRAEGVHRLGNVLMTRDRRPVEIEGRAEGIRDSCGGLREIRVHFSRRAEPIPWPNQPPQTEPLDAA